MLQQTSQSSSASSTLRSRPKWPAPPPPVAGNSHCDNINNCAAIHPNLYSGCVDEMLSSVETLNNVVSKSPSVASSDSIAEYGCTSNVEISDNFVFQEQLTNSYHDPGRPLRPPPPRNVKRSSTPDGRFQTSTVDSLDHDSSQEIAKMSQSRDSIEICRNTPALVDCSDNHTVVHLDTHACHQHAGALSGVDSYNTLPKPPLPYKPKLIIDLNKPNEITKL